MKRNLKIFALLLSVLLIFSVFAISVFADDAATASADVNENIADNGTTDEVKGIEINIDFQRFVNSLQYMWKGMLCIFIVIGVIILITYAFNRVVNYLAFSAEEKKKFKEFKDNEEK